MTRQSSVPPSDDSDTSDNENLNTNENNNKPNTPKPDEKSRTPKSDEKSKTPPEKKKDNQEEGENNNITMEVDKTPKPPETPRKRKRKLRKDMEPRKKNKSDNEEEPKTGAIIISLYDLLNMAENPFEPPCAKPSEKVPKPPSPNPRNYHNVAYNYESQQEDDFNMEVEEYLNLDIRGIDDLIEIGNDYIKGKYDPYKKYNINVYTISKLVQPLMKLKKMIGMENVKQDVFELLLYQLQEFDNSKDMLHTIIEGEPGVGKTDLAKIMAEIYQGMGYCNNKIVKFVKRSDLVGGYLGQTAIKTQKVLDECKGGILVIDEAYSLGSPEGRDSYSKECIDTITSFLSESPDTIVFIMGYHDDLEKSLFAMNKGLERRFSYRFTVNKYTPSELRQILFKIVRENGWDILEESEIPVEFFEKNEKSFIFNGGDMLNLFTKCKFTHSKRFFNESRKSTVEKNITHLKKKINYPDIKNAFQLLQKDEKFKNRANQIDKIFETTFYS